MGSFPEYGIGHHGAVPACGVLSGTRFPGYCSDHPEEKRAFRFRYSPRLLFFLRQDKTAVFSVLLSEDSLYASGSSRRMRQCPRESPDHCIRSRSRLRLLRPDDPEERLLPWQSILRSPKHSRRGAQRLLLRPHLRAISARSRFGMIAGVPLWT